MTDPARRIVVETYAKSDVGRTREHNEDAYAVANLGDGEPLHFAALVRQPADARGTLFMVADGMGGAAAGEIASATAVDVVLKYLREHWSGQSDGQINADAFVRTLAHATEVANAAIFHYASGHPELRGMGTTATIAGLLGDTLYLAQVGDSRAYLIRQGAAFQLTKDQSLMQRLLEAGEISEEEAEQSERRNIILQALGPEAHVRVDLTHQRVRRGDVLILCSDGLSGLAKPDVIARVVREESDLSRVCERLVGIANELGGPDNITVVAARFQGEGLEEPGEADEIGHRHFSLGDTPPQGVPNEPLILREPLPSPAGMPMVDDERRRKGELYLRFLAGLGALAAIYAAWRLFTTF